MLPYPNIGPVIFSIGPISVRWYGLMYVIGYVIGFQILKKRAKAGLIKISYQAGENFITYLIVGMLLGARITYALVYNWDHYSQYPMDIFKIWEGGLSFHGAAIGMVVACTLFARKYKLRFYTVTDSLAYGCVPALFFGRLGNFINGELYGRETDVPWAMIFPTDPKHVPRHPSQLYQALTEGLLLFVFLTIFQNWLIKNKRFRHGIIGPCFLIGYGTLRFLTEFAREPDAQLGFVLGPFSMGQILCFLMILAGAFTLWHSSKVETVFEPKEQSQKALEAQI